MTVDVKLLHDLELRYRGVHNCLGVISCHLNLAGNHGDCRRERDQLIVKMQLVSAIPDGTTQRNLLMLGKRPSSEGTRKIFQKLG